MDVARIKTGKLQLQTTIIDFAILLREIKHVVNNSEHSCYISFNIPGSDEPGLFVQGDPTRLEQIAWNLINNAIKFTPGNGRITVVAKASENHAEFVVTDTGPGIPKAQLQKIFEMFGQANHRPTGMHKGGLGIGLSLVKQLVESHNGSIIATSDGVGKGSSFTVRLPLCGSPELPATDTDPDSGGKLDNVRILLVDDSPDVLETMAMLLEMENAQVLAISDPAQALTKAENQTFDVVVSDVSMPGMDGYQFVQALRQLKGYQRTPCIALTGYGASQAGHAESSNGFDKHVGKPVDYDEFIDLIASFGKLAANP
jgi:two-component system CheB/CheR fusion protein